MTDLAPSVDRLTRQIERLQRTIDDRDAQIGQMAAMAMKPPTYGIEDAVKILRLAREGTKIDMIKALRELCSCPLKDAKEHIEHNFRFPTPKIGGEE